MATMLNYKKQNEVKLVLTLKDSEKVDVATYRLTNEEFKKLNHLHFGSLQSALAYITKAVSVTTMDNARARDILTLTLTHYQPIDPTNTQTHE